MSRSRFGYRRPPADVRSARGGTETRRPSSVILDEEFFQAWDRKLLRKAIRKNGSYQDTIGAVAKAEMARRKHQLRAGDPRLFNAYLEEAWRPYRGLVEKLSEAHLRALVQDEERNLKVIKALLKRHKPSLQGRD